MFELRILSGLHRGATLPLDDDSLRIGASDSADVVLVDPSIEEDHAELSRTEFGWLLAALGGKLYGAENNQPEMLIDLLPGQFVRIGDIWITIADTEDRWIDPPAVPVDEPIQKEEAYGKLESQEYIASYREDNPTSTHTQDDEITNANGEEKAGEVDQVLPKKGGGRRMLFMSIAGVTVLSAAVAYGMTAKSSQDLDKHKKNPALTVAKLDPIQKSKGAATLPIGQVIDESQSVTQTEQLKKAFRKRLADADLLKRLEMTLDDQAWSVQGNLNDEDAKRFERVLKAFIAENRIDFPVNAKVVSAEGMLPFKISQVITGKEASIVTDGGDRLYVGDEMQGFRLVAINEAGIKFDGKHKLDVRW